MANLNPLLQTLHRILRQLEDVRDRLERGPRGTKARQSNLVKLEAALQKAKDDVRAARMHADQRELQLKSAEAKILDLGTKLNMVKTPREYQAYTDQIAADRMACSVLSDEILETLDRVEQAKSLVPPAEQAIATAQEDLKKFQAAFAAEQPKLEAELARLTKQLAEAEGQMPSEVLHGYQRVVKSKGADALAPMQKGTCTGCHHSITGNVEIELRSGRSVFCRNCGRLLYLAEELLFGGAPRA